MSRATMQHPGMDPGSKVKTGTFDFKRIDYPIQIFIRKIDEMSVVRNSNSVSPVNERIEYVEFLSIFFNSIEDFHKNIY